MYRARPCSRVPTRFPLWFPRSICLYACGGPTPDGSLREIKVMRQGKEFKTLDFYKFIKGDGQDDVILRAGDILVIPSSGARVALTGEVRKPALYEMKEDETLRDALRYAGGVKASGVDQIVQLNTIEPGQSRVLKNINLRDKARWKPRACTTATA